MEINKVFANGDVEDCTERFQTMCLIMYDDSDQYSGIRNGLENSTLLVKYNYPKTITVAYDVLCCYNKPVPPRKVYAPPAVVTFFQSSDAEKNKITLGNDER